MTQPTVVLLGIGHTNAHIISQWAKSPPDDARLVCISPYPIATYSGMLPGTLSRQYEPGQMQIELEPLCQTASAELHISKAVAVDCAQQQVELQNGERVAYDLLSIGIGSVPQTEGVELDSAATKLVKPMQTLIPRLDQQLQQLMTACQRRVFPLRMIIVGGGAAGVEIACCLDRRLELEFPEALRELIVVEGHRTVLAAESEKTQQLATGLMQQRGIQLLLEQRVIGIHGNRVELQAGDLLSADLVIWAAGAGPPSLLEHIDLPRDDAGFLLTRPTLQSTGDDRVFAVGDTGTIGGESYAKAGVYAVRQGPVLWHNLQAMLRGEKLEEYHPQQKFLRLFNTADGRAILAYHGWVRHARWCWWLKDWIDRRFVGKYQL